MTVARKSSVSEELEPAELLALARLAIERNDIESALIKLKKVIAVSEPPIEAVSMAARIYAQLGLFDRAEKLYEQYLEKHPGAVVERFQLGMTRFDAGKSVLALETWERVLKEQPAHPPALFYKSLVLAQSGKVGEAKQILDGLLKSVPADNLYFGRGKELLQAIESGRVAQAPAIKNNGGTKAATPLPPDAYRTEH